MSIPQKIKLKKDTYIKEGEELIGWGSYGEVWKMKRVSDKKIVAVKTIQKKNRYNNDRYTTYMIKEAQKTLDKEIEFLCQLTNSEEYYILPVLDHGKYEGNSFMVMPLADNCLADFIADIDDLAKKEIHLTPERLFKWIIQIATGLQYIHNSIDIDGKPYVHRDFKPKNVLLKDDNAFLCDFGSIKAKKNNDLTGSHIFTISYAAPESLIPKEFKNGKPRYLYGSSADIYSLGISLYCLITQKSSLNCQEELSKYTGNTPNNPHPTLVKHFETIGALSPEEHLLLQEKCHRLFGVKKFEDTTYCPYPALMLPNKKDIVDRIVNLISQMLSPFAIQRPDTKEIIHIAKELKTYYSPKLISLSITAPETIETGDPIDVRINAKGKGLISDGSWLHITLQSSKKTIIFDQFIKEQNDQWRAVFSQKYEPGIYSLNVIACINDREVLEQSKIEVLPEVELTSLSIKSKEYRESGKPIEAYIKITGKFSKKDISSWLFVIIHNSDIQIRANSIVWVENDLWKATFDPKISPGLYTITAKPLPKNNEKYIASTEIKVLDDPITLWKRNEHVEALLQDSKYKKKWLAKIRKQYTKNDKLRKKWMSVLEKVRFKNKEHPDINAIYWEIKEYEYEQATRQNILFFNYKFVCIILLLFLFLGFYLKESLFKTVLFIVSPTYFEQTVESTSLDVGVSSKSKDLDSSPLKRKMIEPKVQAFKSHYTINTNNESTSNDEQLIPIDEENALQYIEYKKKKAYSLSIETIPENAFIRFINFHKSYYDGIQLNPGSYEIEVSKTGYFSRKEKIFIEYEDLNKIFVLSKKKDCNYEIVFERFGQTYNIRSIIKGSEWAEKYNENDKDNCKHAKFYTFYVNKNTFYGFKESKGKYSLNASKKYIQKRKGRGISIYLARESALDLPRKLWANSGSLEFSAKFVSYNNLHFNDFDNVNNYYFRDNPHIKVSEVICNYVLDEPSLLLKIKYSEEVSNEPQQYNNILHNSIQHNSINEELLSIYEKKAIIQSKKHKRKNVCLKFKDNYDDEIQFHLVPDIIYKFNNKNDKALLPIVKECFELKKSKEGYAIKIPASYNFKSYESSWLEYKTNKYLTIKLEPTKKEIKFRVIDAKTFQPIEDATITLKCNQSGNTFILPHKQSEFYSKDIEIYANEKYSYIVSANDYKTVTKKNVSYKKENNPIQVSIEPIIKKTRIEADIYFKEEGKRYPLKEGRIRLRYQDKNNKTRNEQLIYDIAKQKYLSSFINLSEINSPIISIDKTQTFNPIKSYEVQDSNPEIQINFRRPVLYVLINPSRRLLIEPITYFAIKYIFKEKIYFFIKGLLTDPKKKRFWGRKYVYSWHKDTKPQLLFNQGNITPEWKKFKQSIMNISFKNSYISYEEAIKKVSLFLDGFSYPDGSSIKGILVYILGAPREFMDNNMIEKLNNKLKKNRLIAIIQLFSRFQSPFLDDYYYTRKRYKYIKFIETEMQKSFYNDKFSPSFRQLKNELYNVLDLLGENNEIN